MLGTGNFPDFFGKNLVPGEWHLGTQTSTMWPCSKQRGILSGPHGHKAMLPQSKNFEIDTPFFNYGCLTFGVVYKKVVLAISRVKKYDHIILNGKVISSTNYTMNVIKSSLVGVLSTKFAFQLQFNFKRRDPLSKKHCSKAQQGYEIRTILNLEWSKAGWFANSLDFKWDLKFGSPTI